MAMVGVKVLDNFADKVLKAARDKKSVICVGLDPRIGSLPEHLKEKAEGGGYQVVAEIFAEFSKKLIDSVHDIVPVVKPNSAFFEQYGPPGVQAYREVIDHARAQDLIVIGDVKRNDIGSTAEAYANAYIGKVKFPGRPDGFSFFNPDAVTVNPYLGSDGIKPFLKYCDSEHGKGIFILCRTSNKSAKEFQDRLAEVDDKEMQTVQKRLGYADGETPYFPVSDPDAPECLRKAPFDAIPNFWITALKIAEWGEGFKGESGYSSVGAVVGATYPKEAGILRNLMPETLFLVPGYGAQGGGADGVVPAFDEDGRGAVVNSSRGIIFAYQKEPWSKDYTPEQFGDAARQAALYATEDINKALEKAEKVYWE